MVNIRPTRMRTVSDARNGFSTLIADAADGVSTHVMKGSELVAHIVPASTPIIDDQNLLATMICAVTAQEAREVAATEWRDGRLWNAGDPVGRLFAWTWRTNQHLCMQAFAHWHATLQETVGDAIGLGALWGGLETALAVSLDNSEIAELRRYIDRMYDQYDRSPYGGVKTP